MKATVVKLSLVLVSLFTMNTFFISANSNLPSYFLDTKTENERTVSVDRYDQSVFTSAYYKTKTTEYRYDAQGSLIEIKYSKWDESGTEKCPVWVIKYQYDFDKNLTEALLYRWNNKTGQCSDLLEKMNYSFNEGGRLMVIQHSKKDNNEWKVTSTSNAGELFYTEVR